MNKAKYTWRPHSKTQGGNPQVSWPLSQHLLEVTVWKSQQNYIIDKKQPAPPKCNWNRCLDYFNCPLNANMYNEEFYSEHIMWYYNVILRYVPIKREVLRRIFLHMSSTGTEKEEVPSKWMLLKQAQKSFSLFRDLCCKKYALLW